MQTSVSASKKNVFPPPFYLKQCLNEGHLPAFGHHCELGVIVWVLVEYNKYWNPKLDVSVKEPMILPS